MILEFLPEAVAEVAEAISYYETREPGLGVRLRLEIESACEAIVQHPLLWRVRPGGYRRVNLPGFPYYIAYFVRSQRLMVAAVGHASRHPNYWKKRPFDTE